jgi:hypothetical protein
LRLKIKKILGNKKKGSISGILKIVETRSAYIKTLKINLSSLKGVI